MQTIIGSPQNDKVKFVVKLNKRGFRDDQRQTVAEGGREIGQALAAGHVPRQVFVCSSLLNAESEPVAQSCRRMAEAGRTTYYEVSDDVFAKMAYRESAGGILAVIPYVGLVLEQLAPDESALALVVDGAEKPGNLGAILRSADAAGVAFVIVCGDGTDVNNPNVIRASIGALFTLPIVQTGSADAIAWLRANGYRTVAATPGASELYTGAVFTGATAVVVGSEAHGLGVEWLKAADQCVRIPMYGRVDSLNLSVSTAILLYEAVRQRSTTDQ